MHTGPVTDAPDWTRVEVPLSHAEAEWLGWLAVARGCTVADLVRRGLSHLPISGDDRRAVALLKYDADLARMERRHVG